MFPCCGLRKDMTLFCKHWLLLHSAGTFPDVLHTMVTKYVYILLQLSKLVSETVTYFQGPLTIFYLIKGLEFTNTHQTFVHILKTKVVHSH